MEGREHVKNKLIIIFFQPRPPMLRIFPTTPATLQGWIIPARAANF
nr:MAG TPA: hypothetical protein [Caudoviricetes sp.]